MLVNLGAETWWLLRPQELQVNAILLQLLINQAKVLLQPKELGPEDEDIHLVQKICVVLFFVMLSIAIAPLFCFQS